MARGSGHTKRPKFLLKIFTSIFSAVKLVLKHLIPKLKCKISVHLLLDFIRDLSNHLCFPWCTDFYFQMPKFELYGSVPIFNWNPQERYILQKSSNKFDLLSQLGNVRLYFAISFAHYLSREYNLQGLQYTVVQLITKHKIPLKINTSKRKSVLISDMLEKKYFVFLIKTFLYIIIPWSLAFKYSCFLYFQ